MGTTQRLKSEEEIRANVEAQFLKKKECEAKALDVVHRMVESSCVDETFFQDASHFLNPNYYHDVNVERGIAKLCGYPLCSNKLESNVSKQKYHISTKTNTVYDVTGRVDFCSNQCFKASNFYAKQIPTDPLWTRKKDEIVKIELLRFGRSRAVDCVYGGEEVGLSLKTNSTPKVSDEHVDVHKRLISEAKKEAITHLLFDKESGLKDKLDGLILESDSGANTSGVGESSESGLKDKLGGLVLESNTTNGVKESVESGLKHKRNGLILESNTSNGVEESMKSVGISRAEDEADAATKLMRLLDIKEKMEASAPKSRDVADESQNRKRVTFADEVACKDPPQPTENKPVEVKPPLHPLDPIWHTLRAWITRATVTHVWADRLNLQSKESSHENDQIEKIIRRLDKEEDLDTCDDGKENEKQLTNPKKPMPDFEKLKTNEFMNEQKVIEFFKGSCRLPTKIETSSDCGDVPKEEKDKRIVLPLTDRLSQLMIRRNLVMDRLRVVLPDICISFGLTMEDVTDEIKNLVSTFHLESQTILFRPGQWAVVVVMLLKMASIRNGKLWHSIHSQKSVDILIVALDQIGIRLIDVDNIVALLTDPKEIQESK